MVFLPMIYFIMEKLENIELIGEDNIVFGMDKKYFYIYCQVALMVLINVTLVVHWIWERQIEFEAEKERKSIEFQQKYKYIDDIMIV